jgi:hypothetical protein
MVDEDLRPKHEGEVQKASYNSNATKIRRMEDDIERHGEVHANFKDVDGRVECRLGTVRMDEDGGIIEVFDGDQFHPFMADQLVDWEVPMDVYHH